MPANTCVHCAFGLDPVKMKRQWVHYFRDRIAICEDRNIKPERLAAAAPSKTDPER